MVTQRVRLVGEAVMPMAESGELPHLTEATRRLALHRFGLLRPHLDNGVSLAKLADLYTVPLRTLERWLQRYRQDGLGGLVRKPYANRGRRRLPSSST